MWLLRGMRGRVSLHGVCKSFGEVAVVHDVDLEVADHEFVVFVGRRAAARAPCCA
jgi:ABC-type sugar transport system ATPase subunit